MTMRNGSMAMEVQFESMTEQNLDAVLQVEQTAYPHPWNRSHFSDALQSGNQAQMLVAGQHLLGYFVAMPGVDEVHLLNITVAPRFQRQGWSRMMLEALAIWARGQSAQCVWLEVRVSNQRALQVYEAHGFERVGLRKDYYPAGHGRREDAVVMRLALQERNP